MHGRATLLDMEAESSLIADVGGSRPLRDQLAAVFTAFEQAAGLQVCVKPMSDRWRGSDGLHVIPGPFLGHRSPFCHAVKARAFPACAKCDRADLPAVCAPPEGRVVEPFIRTCHAGAEEVLVPLWSDGVLVAVLFAGQFTSSHRDPPGPTTLRLVTPADAQHLQTLMLPLRSYLLDVLRRLDNERNGHAVGRRGAIEAYVRESLSSGPTLPELASRLSLSRSRASHAVRELTGRSFQDLVEERRIAVARDLLANGDGTVAWVARQTGFNDTAYFCRYFKRKTGTTPTSFRKQYRRVLPV